MYLAGAVAKWIFQYSTFFPKWSREEALLEA